MIPNLNRREALGVLGTIGAAAAALPSPHEARAAGVDVGRFVRRAGVQGKMTGAQAAVAALACEMVHCVFGVPGAQNNEFWDAMKARVLPYLLVTNESSASIMADAAARATGEVGVFAVVPGPGLTNAMTGIGEALLDSVPIVGLVTDVNRAPGAPIGQVHSLPNAALLRPIVKCVIEIHHVSEIPGAIHQAFRVARSGEPGPVAVVIPFTFYGEAWDFDQGIPPPFPVPFDESVYPKVVAHLANQRGRVGIYAGLGCVNAGPSLVAVAEMLQAPVATSVSGKGSIPDQHPLAVGWGYGKQGTRAAERAFHEVDVVLAIGVKFSEVSTANFNVPKKETLIHVDVNPHNLGRNVPAHVTLCADSRTFLDRLLADGPTLRRCADPALHARIKKDRAVDRAENSRVQIPCAVDPMVFYTQLRQLLGPEELIFVDVTASTHWASETIDVPGPRRYFTPANNQAMGWAIPASIGAQQVRPDRMVVSVTGDGCFLMSAIEMSTAARAGLPVKFFVLDDGGYHYMQMLQEPVFRRTTATEIARIDYAAFAAAVGLGYNQISRNEEIGPGLSRSLGMRGPVLTRVVVGYEGRDIRWLNAVRSNYLRKLPTDQKVRVASRVGVRTLQRYKDND